MEVNYASEIQNFPVWVVEVDDRIVGGLVMAFGRLSASVENIAVDPAFQGKGIGGKLMRYAESRARERKCQELHLHSDTRLVETISLYRHLGWEEVDRDEFRISMKKMI